MLLLAGRFLHHRPFKLGLRAVPVIRA